MILCILVMVFTNNVLLNDRQFAPRTLVPAFPFQICDVAGLSFSECDTHVQSARPLDVLRTGVYGRRMYGLFRYIYATQGKAAYLSVLHSSRSGSVQETRYVCKCLRLTSHLS